MNSDEYLEHKQTQREKHLHRSYALAIEFQKIAPLAMELPLLAESIMDEFDDGQGNPLEAAVKLATIELALRKNPALRTKTTYEEALAPDTCAISEQIVRVRDKRRLSQEAFAKELGVSTRTVARWEAGVCVPKAVVLRALGIAA